MGIEAVRSLWWERISPKIWPNMFPSRWKLEVRKSIGQDQNRLQNPQNAAWRKGSNQRHEDRSWPIRVFCEWEPVRVSSATVAATVYTYVYIYIHTPHIVCTIHYIQHACLLKKHGKIVKAASLPMLKGILKRDMFAFHHGRRHHGFCKHNAWHVASQVPQISALKQRACIACC